MVFGKHGFLVWLLLPLVLLSGCGEEETVIAERVRFRVNFEEQLVQISFRMNPDYEIETTVATDFENLGQIFLDYEEFSNIGSTINANPDVIESEWPTALLTRFPNKKKLPALVRNSELQIWKQTRDEVSNSLIFSNEPHLIAGGNITSSRFNDIPFKFLATQEFRNSAGAVTATISIAGPTVDSLGGIYFFGNFGINPFDHEFSEENVEMSLDGRTMEWVLEADEPAKVVSYGHWWEWFKTPFTSALEKTDRIRHGLKEQLESN